MLIDGEKYACEACIRGHRVSSCNHSDRELVHVARKGRPISQCQHCRGQRKARAQHVNCQCGANAHDKEHCPKTDGSADSKGCCCSHTSKCTCAIKKDKSAQVVHDDGSPLHPRESPKPLAHIKNCHDNKPMVFTGNGHHKPAHKFNDAHHQLGSPYKIPSRASSVNHHQSLAQRSTDSLPLTKFARPHHESPLHHSLTPRQIKSEHNSPMVRPTNMPSAIPNDLLLPEYDPNAYSYSPFPTNTNNVSDVNQNLNMGNPLFDGYAMPVSQTEDLQAQNVDWNSYDFSAFGANPNNNPYLNDPNYLGNQGQPLAAEQFGNLNLGMTPSSGDVTDVDEFGFSRTDQPRSQSGDASTGVSSPENSQMDRYRVSVEGTPVLQNNVLNNNDDGLDIDDYLRQAEFETKRMSIQNQMRAMALQQALSQNNSQENLLQQSQPQSSQTQLPAKPAPEFNAGMHPFTVHEAQERAHSTDATPAPEFVGMKPNMPLSGNTLAMDPSWSAPPDMSNPTLSLDDDQEDEDWVR